MLSSRQGKMSEEDRRTVFRRGVQGACAEELFPQQMAIDPCQPEEQVDFFMFFAVRRFGTCVPCVIITADISCTDKPALPNVCSVMFG